MKVSDFVAQYLLDIGVKHVFTLPGGFSQHLNDSIAFSALESVYCLHESAAAFAACGYAHFEKLGVVVVTSGPGVTNALTGVVSAWQDSLPVLVISGDAKVANVQKREAFQLRQGGQQDVPTIEIVSSVTKWASRPKDAYSVKFQLEKAVKAATTPRRGPAWVSIPLDVQAMEMP